MKKLILLLSVLSIFLIPSMSFADVPSSNFSQSYQVMVYKDNKYQLLLSNAPFTKTDSMNQLRTSSNNWYWYVWNGSSWVDTYRGNPLTITSYANSVSDGILSTNHHIYNESTGDVFFSAPVPLIQVVEELPPVILQHGGTVLSVALTGFGILLVVSLIPRLVKQFL